MSSTLTLTEQLKEYILGECKDFLLDPVKLRGDTIQIRLHFPGYMNTWLDEELSNKVFKPLNPSFTDIKVGRKGLVIDSRVTPNDIQYLLALELEEFGLNKRTPIHVYFPEYHILKVIVKRASQANLDNVLTSTTKAIETKLPTQPNHKYALSNNNSAITVRLYDRMLNLPPIQNNQSEHVDIFFIQHSNKSAASTAQGAQPTPQTAPEQQTFHLGQNNNNNNGRNNNQPPRYQHRKKGGRSNRQYNDTLQNQSNQSHIPQQQTQAYYPQNPPQQSIQQMATSTPHSTPQAQYSQQTAYKPYQHEYEYVNTRPTHQNHVVFHRPKYFNNEQQIQQTIPQQYHLQSPITTQPLHPMQLNYLSPDLNASIYSQPTHSK